MESRDGHRTERQKHQKIPGIKGHDRVLPFRNLGEAIAFSQAAATVLNPLDVLSLMSSLNFPPNNNDPR